MSKPPLQTAATLIMAAGLAMPLAAHAQDTTLTIATVNNVQMIEMQKLSPVFEKSHPGIHLNWVVLEENVLRQRVTTDIGTHGGQFDIVTIGNYEVPIWAKQNWLLPFENLPSSFDVDDILKPVRQGLSYKGKLYALPFYAESVMTLYRTDLFKAAGLTMPAKPTYTEIRQFADKVTDKSKGIYGICLRGKPGWGENIAYFSTLVTAFGGQWFDKSWKPTIDTAAWKQALTYYTDILKTDGPPGATSNGFNENLTLFSSGHCGMWIDATSAAGTVYDKNQSKVADSVGFAALPTGTFEGGPTWLWSWNLGIPVSTKHADAARQFITWATSKEYIQLVAKTDGWVNIPPGTRASSFAVDDYKKAAPFSSFVEDAINHSNPDGQTKNFRPYNGAQFVGIPQFQAIGTQVGQIVAATLAGSSTVDQSLKSAQSTANRTIRQAGYQK